MNKISIFTKFLILVLILLNISCSANKKKDVDSERSVDKIYNSAMSFLDNYKYNKASKEFEEVERQHPYSIWATRAQIMSAYVHYKLNNYDLSVSAANRYIELHPGANDIDYALYIVALCYYEEINDYRRDQTNTSKALDAFNNLIRRFPNSEYTRDSKLKIDLVKDHLAAREMNVGRTYQDLDNYIASINRFKIVVDEYSKTSHVPEALARLTELYFALGLYDEAKVYASVLGHNYPNNKWYSYSYSLFKDKKSNLLSNKNKDLKLINVKDIDNTDSNSFLNILDNFINLFDAEEY
ncbi:outer membrane protein assembly factor BamD [Alphaproteobacteria bacterium]|nr:outer membrane protein assembly factor BamD [Alphaproteobacteria bacterium]